MSKLPDALLRGRRFWLINLAAWLFYGIAIFLTFLPAMPPDRRLSMFVFKAVLRSLAAFAASAVLVLLFRRLQRFHARRGWLWVILPAGALLGGTLWFTLTQFAARLTNNQHPIPTIDQILHGIPEYLFVMLAWSAVYWLIGMWKHAREESEAAEQARSLAREAQLRLLTSQLSPHFFFNALTSVRGLVRARPEAAEHMLTRMASFFRYSLMNADSAWTTLGQELSIVEAYLDLEGVRFGDTLRTEIAVSESARSQRIPAFTLFPLVENAVKHGGRSAIRPIVVTVSADVIDHALRIDVCNSGTLQPAQVGPGERTGLRNLEERLQHMLPNKYVLALRQEGSQVSARLETAAR